MHSTLGLMVLTAWPLVVAVLFSRLDRVQAGIWSILGGYLVLPPLVGIDLPMVPALDKDSVAGLSALVGVLALGTGTQARPPWTPWIVALLGLAVLAPFLTAFANPEPLAEGITYRPGLSAYDGFAGAVASLIDVTPFVVGYMLLSTPSAVRQWLRALVAAGLVYTLPMLLEIRLSPQLNVWIYGFFAHDFSQMMRYGGFRPMVFLSHGLWVAMFAASATLAAAALIRDRGWSGRMAITLLWLFAVLILCKSMASIVYALAFVPMILLVPLRWQLRLAAVLATAVLLYPLLRWWNLVPTEGIVAFLTGIDAERAYSLNYRFENETALLGRAALKALTGWGEWNRNHIMDPVSGKALTVTDGMWIVQMSAYGLLGFLWMFGLLAGALLRFSLWAGRNGPDGAAVGLAVILAANLVDLVPNATLTPLTWMTAGALAGLAARRELSADKPAMALRRGPQPIQTVI